MITRKDLEQIAHAFADARVNPNSDTRNANLEVALTETFKSLNSRFDTNRFFNRVAQLENMRLGRVVREKYVPNKCNTVKVWPVHGRV